MGTGIPDRDQRFVQEREGLSCDVPHVVVLPLHTMAKKQGARPAGLRFGKMVGKSLEDLTLLLHFPTYSPCGVQGCLERAQLSEGREGCLFGGACS